MKKNISKKLAAQSNETPRTWWQPQTLAAKEIERLAAIHAAKLEAWGVPELSDAERIGVARSTIVWELARGIFNMEKPENMSAHTWDFACARVCEMKAEKHRALIEAVYARAVADLEAAGLDFSFLAAHHRQQAASTRA
jgi:IS30 family transposase